MSRILRTTLRHRSAAFVAALVVLAPLAARAEEPPPSPETGAAPPQPVTPTPTPVPAQPVPVAPPLPVDHVPSGVVLAPGVPSEDHALVDNSPQAHDGHPLAGYHNGLFYLRDHHDNFRLYIQGRMQLDTYSYFGPGVTKTNLHPTLFVRRIRPEVTGEFLNKWMFMIAGDFGATAIDNPTGNATEARAANAGQAPTATSARFAPADSTRFQAAATDAFINYREASIFNIQVGQFDAPFTLENRTSDKYLQFMERSIAVRAVGIPTNKEIGGMFWGETKDHLFYYSVGPFMGDGINRPNVDSRMDVFGRAFIKPLTNALEKDDPLRDLQIGGSVHYGSRDKDWVNYDYGGLTTQGQFAFWSPVYGGANGATHILPSGDQLALAGELRVPFDRWDLTGEFVYVDNNTREAIEGFQSTNSERFGAMKGYSYYAQLGYWPIGKRDINGAPGYENPSRVDFSKAEPVIPDQALQLLAKWEQVNLKYESASRGGTPDPKNIDGDIKVNALSFGVNYWATKHVRLSLNYVYDMFPDSAPVGATSPGGPAQTSSQRAVAPGNTLGKGVDDSARDNAHNMHELLARFAIAL